MQHAIRPLAFRVLRIRAIRCTLLVILASLLASCGEMIWTSSGHPARSPDQVQILVKTPAHYERLGTVTHLHMEGSPWAEGADGTPIIEDLLTEAGVMGANALLLVDDTTMADTSITVRYQGKAYTLPGIGKSKMVVAQGIFVAGSR